MNQINLLSKNSRFILSFHGGYPQEISVINRKNDPKTLVAGFLEQAWRIYRPTIFGAAKRKVK